jgi:hypothetical protein
MDNCHFLLFSDSIGTFCPTDCISGSRPRGVKYSHQERGVYHIPYISSKMQSILFALRNNSNILSLEAIFPASKRQLSHTETTISVLDYIGDAVHVDIGYSYFTDIYKDRKVYISPQSAQNLGLKPGVFYATCRAVNYKLVKDRPISLIPPHNTDIMGINPETLTEKGYSYTMERTPDGKYSYVFVSYILALSSPCMNGLQELEWICKDFNSNVGRGFVRVIDVEEYMNNLQWRYIY